jgi:rhodanese-related sulfurtransferase
MGARTLRLAGEKKMSQPTELSATEVKARLNRGEKFLLLDVREQDEYDTARIAEATLMPMSQIAERVGEIQAWKTQPIVTHCHKGVRSLRVANWLAAQGFEDVQSMAGGIEAWSLEVDSSVPRY